MQKKEEKLSPFTLIFPEIGATIKIRNVFFLFF